MSVASERADERDAAFMRRALSLAKRGWGQTAPNPMVGAVVVKENVVVGEGYHAGYGEAPRRGRGAARGRGARARRDRLRVARAVQSFRQDAAVCRRTDRGRRLAGRGGDTRSVAHCRRRRRTTSSGGDRCGVRHRGAARRASSTHPSFTRSRSDRPWVTLKLALSIDGAIADASRAPAWLTGKKARREVHRLRAGSDAIAVGLGTVRADNPELTVRDVPPPRVAPARVVFTRHGQLPLASALARTATEVPTIVLAESVDLAHARRLMALGVEVRGRDVDRGRRASAPAARDSDRCWSRAGRGSLARCSAPTSWTG